MRHKSPDRMEKIVKIIERWKLQEGCEPTIADIAKEAGMPPSRVHAYLKEMDEQGIISYKHRQYNTPKTEMISPSINTVPRFGTVKCGGPQVEESEVLEYVRLPASIFGTKEMYLLNASGDSMEDAGIEDGDLIVIENNQYPQKNDIVVALDEESANTLKRYKGSNASGQAILAYENEKRYPGKEIILDQMSIQGIARFIIKRV